MRLRIVQAPKSSDGRFSAFGTRAWVGHAMVSDERTLREHMRLPSYPWGVSRGGTSCDSGMCGVPMLGTARGGVLSGAVCLRGVPSLHACVWSLCQATFVPDHCVGLRPWPSGSCVSLVGALSVLGRAQRAIVSNGVLSRGLPRCVPSDAGSNTFAIMFFTRAPKVALRRRPHDNAAQGED